jgi:hypothetical protein
MFVTVAVIVCHTLHVAPATTSQAPASPVELCEEVIVTDSDLTPTLDWASCTVLGQAPLADWKSKHPVYRSPAYWIAAYKCIPGHYEPGRRAALPVPDVRTAGSKPFSRERSAT